MSVVSRPDLFPPTTAVKFYEWHRGRSIGELLRNNEGTNPTSWKPAPAEVGEGEVNSAGELTVAVTVEGKRGGMVLCAAEVAGKWVYLVARCTVAGKVKVKLTSTQLVGANAVRTGLEIVNAGTHPMYLALGGAAALNSGILLAANGSWDGRAGDELWTGSVFAISETAEQNATVVEL